ncbi:unnamed protein product [Caenorhabditis auriculariae]|uniref:Uncharacterized protein n=1 Tax=Caenorhabditis auriculariae TaxID=2777116 RepID=A0A8S1H0W5_9PELO|nr:unnamed protein product [Caenorhabditis auriculariae]
MSLEHETSRIGPMDALLKCVGKASLQPQHLSERRHLHVDFCVTIVVLFDVFTDPAQKGSFGEEICRCQEGWLGSLCDVFAAAPAETCTNDADCLPDERCSHQGDGNDVVGAFCEKNSCHAEPCQNNATCFEENDSYRCECTPGFGGKQCDADVDECEISVCNNGATCINFFGTFECRCPPNFSGKFCELEDSKECPKNVCENNGKCKSFEDEALPECKCNNPHHVCSLKNGNIFCDCPDGFMGDTCLEQKPSPCDMDPCLNGGQCKDHGNGTYTCLCLPHWSGLACGQPAECLVEGKPCTNGGKCVWALAMTRCECPSGFRGAHCETLDIEKTSVCTDFPCQQGECVIESNGEPKCHCKEGFLPPFCEESSPCEPNPCENSGTCQNADGQFFCHCPTSYTGVHCETQIAVNSTSTTTEATAVVTKDSWVVTTENIPIGTNSDDGDTSLFSSTTCDECLHSTGCMDVDSRSICICEHGYFGDKCNQKHLKCEKKSCEKGEVCRLTTTINDVEARCTCPFGFGGESCQTPTTVSPISSVGYELKFSFRTTLGNVHLASSENILGEKILLIGLQNGRIFFNVTGTTFNELIPMDVNDASECLDLWDSSVCECPAPYLKPNCAYALPASTFGHNDKPSSVIISVAEHENQLLRNSIDVQFLMRSNKNDGELLLLGEKPSSDGVSNYFTVELINGFLQARLKSGGLREVSALSKTFVTNNEQHLIRVNYNKNLLQLYIDENLETSIPAKSRFGQDFYVEQISLGVTNRSITPNNFYKGWLRDIQINEKSLVVHPTLLAVNSLGTLVKDNNVLEGEVSDIVCTPETCLYGNCKDTFNDFECSCQPGYYGKRCDKVDFCSQNICPSGFRCRNADKGHYCTSSITIGNESFVKYELNSFSAIVIPKMELAIRTHSSKGHLFTLLLNNEKISMNVENRRLLLSIGSTFKFDKIISDGEWHQIKILSERIFIDGKSFNIAKKIFSNGRSKRATIIFGHQSTEAVFGCLENVTIGDYPMLSFLNQTVPTTEDFWVLKNKTKTSTTCISSEQCGIYSTCLNGATCVDMWNKRKCNCAPGFSGDHCEENINECQNINCLHGNCIDGINEARCECSIGFGGKLCDEPLDNCEGLQCQNEGQCVKKDGKVKCDCSEGWIGSFCNVTKTSKCVDQPCRNKGICSQQENGFLCQCANAFGGELCEEKLLNQCEDYDCDHGHCIDGADGPQCVCDKGFAGVYCEKVVDYCVEATCNKRGSCQPVWNNTICECEKNWRGSNCEHASNKCFDIPCENDGVCESNLSNPNGFNCRCPKYYLGDRCEVEGSCLQNPCVNGECLQITFEKHACSCSQGYEGPKCDKRIDFCAKKPCINGGSCESLLSGPKCHCIPGFDGLQCETDIDECALGYCGNGAKCKDHVNDYECVCTNTGFKGKNCTEDVDECQTAENCINGKCKNAHGGYKCTCSPGYIGTRCSMVNPCIPNDKNQTLHTCVHGRCINPVVKLEMGHEQVSYECVCDRGYTGARCRTKIEEKKLFAIGYILGPAIAVFCVLSVIGCLLFLFVMKGNNAMHGQYSPSTQETYGNRIPINSIMKLPTQERLI